eukprot:g45413.t1
MQSQPCKPARADCALLCSTFGAFRIDSIASQRRCQSQLLVRECANQTALFLSVQQGFLKVARFLVREGANVNHTDQQGQTALFLAAQQKHAKVVQWLVQEEGANVNCIDPAGRNVLFVAVAAGSENSGVAGVTRQRCAVFEGGCGMAEARSVGRFG